MEAFERDLILRSIPSNRQLKRLYAQHLKIEEELVTFGGRSYLTSQEQVLVSELKKRKLQGVDLMMAMIQDLRSEIQIQ
jgi:hypothetical protein